MQSPQQFKYLEIRQTVLQTGDRQNPCTEGFLENTRPLKRGIYISTSNPGPFGIEAAREKALVKSGHVTPQILDIA